MKKSGASILKETVVLTWVCTADGGAEQSILTLFRTLTEMPTLTTHLLWWAADNGDAKNTAGKLKGACIHRVSTFAEYLEMLNALTENSDTYQTSVISSHRTAAVDADAIRHRSRIVTMAVLRATLLPNENLSTVQQDGVMRPTPTADLLALGTGIHWIGISRSSAISIQQSSDMKITPRFIYNPIADHGPSRPKSNIRATDSIGFAIAARAVSWKEIDLALKAYSILRSMISKECKVRLRVISAGPLLDELKHEAATVGSGYDIEFVNPVENLNALLSDVDCLVHTARREAFGRVIPESALRCIPSIVPSVGGPQELIIKDASGLVFDAGNEFDLARKMAQFAFYSAAKRTEMGIRGRQYAKLMFNPERVALEYLSVIGQLRTVAS